MNDDILRSIYSAIDDLNEQKSDSKPIVKSPETRLFGGGATSTVDSLDLIDLVVAVEENIEKNLGVAITLVDDRALSAQVSPFTSVKILASYIEQLITERKDG